MTYTTCSSIPCKEWYSRMKERPHDLPEAVQDSDLGVELIASRCRKLRHQVPGSLAATVAGIAITILILRADRHKLNRSVFEYRVAVGTSFLLTAWATFNAVGYLRIWNALRKRVDWDVFENPGYPSDAALYHMTIWLHGWNEFAVDAEGSGELKEGELWLKPHHWANERIYFETVLRPWLAEALRREIGQIPHWGEFEDLLQLTEGIKEPDPIGDMRAVYQYVSFLEIWKRGIENSDLGYVKLTPEEDYLGNPNLPAGRPRNLPKPAERPPESTHATEEDDVPDSGRRYRFDSQQIQEQ